MAEVTLRLETDGRCCQPTCPWLAYILYREGDAWGCTLFDDRLRVNPDGNQRLRCRLCRDATRD